MLLFFFFLFSAEHLDLLSFPTRRSSDLYGKKGFLKNMHWIIQIRWILRRKVCIFQPHEVLDYKQDRKSTRLNSSHVANSYAVFCLKKKKTSITYQYNTLIHKLNILAQPY